MSKTAKAEMVPGQTFGNYQVFTAHNYAEIRNKDHVIKRITGISATAKAEESAQTLATLFGKVTVNA